MVNRSGDAAAASRGQRVKNGRDCDSDSMRIFHSAIACVSLLAGVADANELGGYAGIAGADSEIAAPVDGKDELTGAAEIVPLPVELVPAPHIKVTRQNDPVAAQSSSEGEQAEGPLAAPGDSAADGTVVSGPVMEVIRPRFQYRMHVRTPSTDDVVCRRDMVTGSHTKADYCRSREMAEAEEDAAREFIQEAWRN